MNKKGFFLVLGTALISGFSIFINKFGVSFSDPVAYTFFKNVCVALAISGIIFFWGSFKNFKKIARNDWIKLVAIGLIGGSIPFVLFFKGLSLTSAAQGAFIHKSMFILVAILAWGFLKEKIRLPFLFGGLLLFLGNFLFLKKTNLVISQGDFLIFLATCFWAVENIIAKKVLNNVDWRVVVWSRMTFGSVVILAYLIFSRGLGSVLDISLNQASWAIVAGLLLFGYQATWYSGLRYLPVSVATSILLLGSSVTAILGFIQKNQIDWQASLASIVVCLGVVIIVFSEKLKEMSKKIFEYVRS